MTAEELLVQRFLELEKKYESLNDQLEEAKESYADLSEELKEYQEVFSVLQRHLESNRYCVTIEFTKYTDEGKADLEVLKDFLDIDLEEEDEAE